MDHTIRRYQQTEQNKTKRVGLEDKKKQEQQKTISSDTSLCDRSLTTRNVYQKIEQFYLIQSRDA